MGPLLAHIELQGDSGDGRFDAGSTGSGVVLNAGYVQWAGVTAGKHGSFYDYLAGGDTWKDFFSPDHSGTPINLLAYTATFGGGFSATLSLEQNELVAGMNIPWSTIPTFRALLRPPASTAPVARNSAFARPTLSPAWT